jgi:hypothetical protein
MIKEKHEMHVETEQLQQEGSKALIINIVFFVILLAGVLIMPLLGFKFAAIAIALAFVLSMVYIYMT